MASPCCTNTITPQMIRRGEMKIGDQIHLDEVLVSAPLTEQNIPDPAPVSIPASAPAHEAVHVHAAMEPAQSQGRISMPLTYDQMTPYMPPHSAAPSGNMPMFTVPQTPMTTQNFQETIDSTDVESYLGFMRTQIGRYMRIEQLMGSNNVEQRFGFLVGLGTNYIILQEITSGNIMVIDLFTIRLTYIYYSDPVVPPAIPY